MIRTLIVDDELYAREELMQHLAAEPDIELLGHCQCHRGAAAYSAAQTRRGVSRYPDAQTQRHGAGGHARSLPRIVFVTAFDEYAIQAFEENAFDYLLKPVEPARLAKRWRGSGKI